LVFATRGFPVGQEMMREKLKCTAEPLNWIVQGFFEIGLSTTFFSIYLPLWSKWCCKTVTSIMWDYHTDGSRDEVFVERSTLVINLLLDLTRYVYGRGVLFKVSSLVVFCLLLLKDTVYQFWHFGFKYTEEYSKTFMSENQMIRNSLHI
jgi:hypothetical protein